MRCYAYNTGPYCYLPGSKGRAAFHSPLKPNDSWGAALLQGPRVKRSYQNKAIWYSEYFSFVCGQMEKPKHTLWMLLTAVKKPPWSHAVKKKPWFADTWISTCKTNWPLGAMKYLQNYFVLYLPVMIFTEQFWWFMTKQREGWEAFQKIICHCSHFICFLPTCISSQEHSYSVLLFSTELKMPHWTNRTIHASVILPQALTRFT